MRRTQRGGMGILAVFCTAAILISPAGLMAWSEHPLVTYPLMAAMPDYSLVINATGMGKDTPGSPITNAGLVPQHGVAGEFNDRGELDFLHQALAQTASRSLTVEDGWLYFVHGWTQVIAQVLHVDLTSELFNRLEAIAATVR